MADTSGRYSVKFVGNSTTEGTTIYVIKVTNGESETWNIEKRYSEIRELYEKLRGVHGDAIAQFPGKKMFGSTDPAFITSRQLGLQSWFDAVLRLEPNIQTPALKEFVGAPRSQGGGVNQTKQYQQILDDMQAKLLNLALPPAPLDQSEVDQRLKKYGQAMKLHVLSQPVDPIHLRTPGFDNDPLQLCSTNADQLDALKSPPAKNDAVILGTLLDSLHAVVKPSEPVVDPSRLIVPFPKVSLPPAGAIAQ